MTTTQCWHCHEKTLMVDPSRSNAQYVSSIPSHIFPDYEFQKEEDDETDFRIYSCTNCGYPNIAEVTSEFSVGEIEDDVQSELRIIRWLPIEPIGKDYDSVPSDIASVASEAHKCQQIGAYRAANILARTTIEAVIDEQLKKAKKSNQGLGQEKDNSGKGGKLLLDRKIEIVKENDLLSKRTIHQLNLIKKSGNQSTHDITATIKEPYSKAVLIILDLLLDDVYTQEAIAEKVNTLTNQHNSQK